LAGVRKLSPLSPPPSEFCNDENNLVITNQISNLEKFQKITLLIVTVLFF
jgi:hypothetical protein